MKQTNTTDNTNHMLGGAIKNKGFSDYQKTLERIAENCQTLRLESDDFPELLDKCRELYIKNSKMLDEHARDILQLSCLTVLSICFPTVRLPYGSGRYSINFNMLFGAPSGSNKSVMKYASMLLNALNRYLGDKYKEELREWQHSCERWEQEKKLAAKEKREINFDLEPGEKPLFASIRIPVNSSKSMMIDLIKGNEKYGNLADTTELDSLNDANSKDYGNLMDLFNKAVMNELIDKAFRIDGTSTYIPFPMLSLMASGTLDQLHRFIVSYETGLGSRMPVYLSPDLSEFICQKPSPDAIDFNKYYDQLSQEVLEMWKFFTCFNFIVTFSDEQWEKHTELWKEYFAEVRMTRREMLSVSTRFGMFHMRIASVLTMLRLWDEVKGDIETNRSIYVMGNEHAISCNDTDFETASIIASTIFEHTMTFSTSKVQQINTNVKAMENWHWQFEVLKLMPHTFTCDDFKAIATKPPFSKSASQSYNVLGKMAKGKGKAIKKLKARVDGHVVYQKMTEEEK